MLYERMKTSLPSLSLSLTLMLSVCLVPCSGGSVYFLNKTVKASEGKQFSLSIGHDGPMTDIVNAIVRVDNSEQDFVGSSQVASFAPGRGNVAEVTFMVYDDAEPEIEETYTFELDVISPGTTVTIPNMATVIIEANDDAYGVFSISDVSTIYTKENQSFPIIVDVDVSRSVGVYGQVTVSYKVESSDPAAVVGEDIGPPSGTITFYNNERNVKIQLRIFTDVIPENDEEFHLILTNATKGARILNNNVTIVIEANDAPIRFAQSEFRFDEGPVTREVRLTVNRGLEADGVTPIGPADGIATVDYMLLPDTARSGSSEDWDFRGSGGGSSGQVVFPAGIRTGSVVIEINDDDRPEMEESFQVVLSNEDGDVVLVEPNRVNVIISANDNPYGILSLRSDNLISQPRVQVDEDEDSDAIFTVYRTAGHFGTVTIDWEVIRDDGSFEDVDLDIAPISGTVTFTDGVRERPIILYIEQDQLPEPSERFKLRLLQGTVTGGARVEGILEGIIIIEDSDNIYGVVEFAADIEQKLIISSDPRVLELKILRSGANVGDLHINLTVSYQPTDGGSPNVLEDTAVSTVMSAGLSEMIEHIHLLPSAFIQVGGRFAAELQGVALVSEPSIGAFNSPVLGNKIVTTVTVTAAEANGEIGFHSLEPMMIDELEFSPNQVEVKLTREGISGDATISWSLRGTGENAAQVTPEDMEQMDGTVVMLSGMSETSFTITVLPDDIPELNEEMTLTLTGVEPATQRLKQGAVQRLVVIKQNDNPGGVFQFAESDPLLYTLAEGEAPVEFTVERIDGGLLEQSIQYIIPSGELEFYGATNVLAFPPGVMSKRFSVAAISDGIPELEEVFTLRIQSFGDSDATIGLRSSVELHISKNDDPHGIVDLPERFFYLNESTKEIKEVATVPVRRTRGLFGSLQIKWSVDPSDELDLRPSTGYVTFNSEQDTAFITVESVPDDITEPAESFILTLSEPSGGAVIGQESTCTIVILENDYPIYFNKPVYEVEEPSQTLILIRRDGPTDPVVTLRYQTIDGTANSAAGDYEPIVAGEITFNVGEAQKEVLVRVLDDSVPEGAETFFLQVYQIIGDAVFNGSSQANITILDNDNAYGIFRFAAPFSQNVEEGSTVNYAITRDGGAFGGVDVFYELYNTANNVRARDGGDFIIAERLSVRFEKGEITKYISLSPRMDNEPEIEKTYTIQITRVEVFDGRTDVTLAKVSDADNSATITILASDDPNGRFGFPIESQEQFIAEDYYPGMESTTRVSLKVDRRMGNYGSVQVMWEAYSDKVAGGLPKVYDLIFLGTIPPSLMLFNNLQRPGTKTNVVYFTGNSAAFIIIADMYQPSMEEIVDGLSISAWVQPLANTNGYIMAKTNPDGSRHFYTVRMHTSSLQTDLTFGYSITGSNENAFETVGFRQNIEDQLWHHVAILVGQGSVQFFLDAALIGTQSLATSQSIIDNYGRLTVGAKYPGDDQFSGYLQDVRIYSRKLTDVEILELYRTPAHFDITPISGYLTYPITSRDGEIDIESVQDNEEEGDEVFTVRLLAAKGGATLSLNDNLATVTVLKSDNANGLFYFPQQCQPALPSNEGTIVTCTIARQRGDNGQVIVTWAVYQIFSGQFTLATEDFVDYTGQVVFEAGERSKTFTAQIKADGIPEPEEVFEIRLVNVTTEDGIVGTTNTSGASIDPTFRSSVVTMKENDFPNGLLQFSTSLLPPRPDDPFIPPDEERPVIRVREEAGTASLLVVRAQGYEGEVSVEWKTTDGTAKSFGKIPADYSAAVGRITMRDRERYAYIDITIIDNDIPEDEKTFVVTLLNPSGGAALGIASEVTVVIEHSDGAFGVFQFKDTARFVQAVEMGDNGYNIVLLQMERTGGSIGESIVSWEVLTDKSNDIVDHSGNVTFTNGQLTGAIGLKVSGDAEPELDELFVVLITTVTRKLYTNSMDPDETAQMRRLIWIHAGRKHREHIFPWRGSYVYVPKGELGIFLRSEVTILANDDPYGRFVMPVATRTKRVDEANTMVTMTIQRLGGMYGIVEVNYTTLSPLETFPFIPLSISRADLQDYRMSSGSVTFNIDQETADFGVEIFDDNEPEEDEALYVRLTGVRLVRAAQIRPVDNSPSLGSESETYGQIIINLNDNANGELVLSPMSPLVPENQTEPFLFVTRYGGAFGQVAVSIIVTDGTAREGLDYMLSSPQVTLERGQKSAEVPLRIIDDTIAELSETFTVQLDQVSGGGILGSVTSTIVYIDVSDDPNGAFEFTVDGMTVEEPENDRLDVEITVQRTGGTMGVITLNWEAFLNGNTVIDDITPTSGSIFFVSNDPSKKIQISILPDDIPEGQENFEIKLMSVTNGRIGARNVFTLTIQSNDNPHGVVQFAQTQYSVEELETDSQQTLLLTRTGGSYGQLRVYYKTARVMYVQEDVLATGNGVLDYFHSPILGGRGIAGEPITVLPTDDPVRVCAVECLRKISCSAFEVFFFNGTGSCTLYDTTTTDPLPISSSSFQYYEKDFVKAGELTGVHATPGEDYTVVTSGYVLIEEGIVSGEIPVTIKADSIPELDEKFVVMLTRVDVSGEPPSAENSPYLGETRNATVTILANDDTYGAFTVYSDSPLASEDGHVIQVEEVANRAVELVVERQGGAIGEVSVDWTVDLAASTATYNVDFRADGATLTFNPGDTRKLISVTILDDDVPELAKDIVIRLSNVQGGATIKYDNATVVVLENDNVAGVVSLSSTSLVAEEGDTVSVDVLRSPSQFGTVTVNWEIQGLGGLDPSQTFVVFKGSVEFQPGENRKTIVLDVMTDNIPEVNQEYQLFLMTINTIGVGVSGAATFDPQLRTASITIEGSNNPHGVVQFGSDSLNVRVNEDAGSVNVQVDRKFGAIGTIRIDYEITSGSVSMTNEELVYASQNEDFVAKRDFIDMFDGIASASIPVTILEDDIPEVDEVFIVRLLNVSLISSPPSSDPPVLGSSGTVSQVIINANDGTKGEVVFAPGSDVVSVDEVSRNISLTINRDRGTFGDVSVFFYVENIVEGTNLGLDYKVVPQELIFLNGDRTRQIQIEIINDDIPEPDEVFEVVLSNPKNGLLLGTPSRATVTILANDDAAGFVYFEDVEVLILDEPTADASLVTSAAIVIQRGPGMYGVVNVPFEIIPELETNREDLSPMQGTATFQNKETSVSLTINVLDDDIPEDAERFTLRLLQPDGTAQLGTKTERIIIINANDSPNGLFSLYAADTRMREISVEEGVGMLHFDIIRTQGMEGQVKVDMATEPGTAETTGDVSAVSLVPVQVLETTYVEGWSSFTVNETVFILMHKPSVVGEMTSQLGSEGSAGAVDMATLMYTTLFRWQGEMIPVQTVETDGISASVAFVIDDIQYLLITNQGNHNRYETYSRLYRVDHSGQLLLLQNLDSRGATDAAYFSENGIHYVVIANSQDNGGNTEVNTDIWRWEPGNKRFSKVAVLRTLGASSLSVFEVEDKIFLAVTNFYDSILKTYQLDSKIYRFDSTEKFSQYQSIPTSGAIDVEHVRIRSLDLLIFANNRDNTVSSPQKSDVYRWDTTAQAFVLHERLETNRVEEVEVFTAFDDTVYALFANTIGSSAMFAWDVQASHFDLVWTGAPALSLVPITIPQEAGLMNLVAIADKEITANAILYQLIKVKDSDYAPRTVTMTMDEDQDLLHATVYVIQDTIPEDTETFYVFLRNPSGGAEIGVNNRIAVNILSNDNAHGIIEIAQDSLEILAQELPGQDNPVQFNVIRHQGYFGHVTVKWVATGDHDGTNDITPLEGLIEIPTGQAGATIQLIIRDDDIAELQEVTYIQLTQIVESGTVLPGRGAQLGLNKTGKLIVLANDSPYGVVKWNLSRVTTTEPEGSDKALVLYIIREQGLAGDLQVTYRTSVDRNLPEKQQAISGEDFISQSGSMVVLQENTTSAAVEIVIKQDDIPEPAEMFLVNITGVRLIGETPAAGAEPSVRIPGNVITVTIAENDDARGIVQFDVTTNIEGRIDVYEEFGKNSTVPLRVSRSVGFFGAITVIWEVNLFGEASSLDCGPLSGTLNFADDQGNGDILITIIDDNVPEEMETFEVTLVSVTGGAALGPRRIVKIGILKNDSPNGLFRFATSQVIVRESTSPTDPDGEVRLSVERIQGSEGFVNVQWRLNAEAVYDFYEPHTGMLKFVQGETSKQLSLRTKPDNILEGEERFHVSLITADNNADISHTQGDAEVIVLPDPGASGTISIMPEYRTVYIGEPGESDPNYNGKVQVVLTRGAGIYGDVSVSWSITPREGEAFLQYEGTVTMTDLQQKADIVLQALDDTIPERQFIYTLKLSSATGGAVLSDVTAAITADIVYVASDYPHGEFVFDLPQEYVATEGTYPVSFSVIRRAGKNNRVFVTYKTYPGTAVAHEDYFPEEGTLTFEHGQDLALIDVQLKEDNIPEGPESFYVNLTSVRLVDESINNYTTVAGLQLDQPPVIGSLNVKEIIIERNDNAEGTIEFTPEAIDFYVTEEEEVAKIPLIRNGGNFGMVSVLYRTDNETASEGIDYVRPPGELVFADGQREATLDVTIRNDPEMEYAERFTVKLLSTTGGALLGDLTMVTVIIAKSDYPNGRFGFRGETDIIMSNPATLNLTMFSVERTGGLTGDQTVNWRIFGPNNPSAPLLATNDIAFVSEGREFTAGSLQWLDGEGGEKTFTLSIKPFSSWEIEKVFVIKLESVVGSPSFIGNGEVSPTSGSVTLTISKFGHPNGIVRFDGPAQFEREVEEPEGSGTLTLQFPIIRRQDTGTVGNIEVFWEVKGPFEEVSDLQPRNGSILVADEERSSFITLEVLPDDIPELTETFQLGITRILGGAEVDKQYSTSTFRIKYNDDPHGVFGIIPEYQTVIVDPVDLSRYVQLNFTRYRGQFGRVILTFNIRYDNAQSGIVLKVNDPTITFNENEENKIVDIEIQGTGFLEVGTTFSLSLSEVQFLGPGVTAPPKFQSGQTEAKVYVPSLAANSKVGFKETVTAVDEESSTCRLTVIREGVYGTLEVSWQSGFEDGRVPFEFVEGTMTPDSSSIRIPHGIDEKNFTILLTARWDVPELFAVHLPVAPSTTVAGGARLLQDRTLVRIEPYGLLRFADNSTNPSVSEMFGKIYLHVLRLYGSEGKLEARYRAEGISAIAGTDFNTVENHAVVMEPGQTSALIMIEVLQDNTPEQEEIFNVNLTDVEKFPTETAPSISPRISYIHPSAVVTIAESNDPYGVLHIEPATLTVPEFYQAVNLTITRTGGIFGTVSVVVRTVGGGEGWTSQINPKEGNGNDTIREVLFNRDKLSSATSSEDYVVLDTSVTFLQGEIEKNVQLTILADDLAEPDETVLVYLTQPTGGARIAEGEPDGGRKGFAAITIARNDLSNGLIGFSGETLDVIADEDARIPAMFKLVRTVAIYGQVEITWKAKLRVDSTVAEDVVLGEELEATSGTAICPGQQKFCHFNVTLIDDTKPEEEYTFIVELVSVQNDAKLDPEASIATVTVEPSDYVRGLIEFTDDSRDVVVSNLESDVRLAVRRVKGQNYPVEVAYRTIQMNRQETVNGVTVSPALEGEDFEKQSGQLVFEPDRQEIKYIDINLTPFLAFQDKYPKQFYIELGAPTNGASLNPDASRAYILIAEPKDLVIWDIIKDIEDKPLNDDNIRDIIDQLDDGLVVNEDVTEDQISLTEKILNGIVEEGLKRKLPTQLIGQLVNLLCKLLSPDKSDATRGRTELAVIMENVAYMLVTEGECPSPNPPKLHTKQCPYASIAAGRWQVGKIEGYQYPGQRQDEFVIPKNIPNIPETPDSECQDFHLIEYTSEQWFQRGEEKELLSNKVVSFGVKGRQSTYTDFPVKYRIHSPDRRITTSRAKCVYFDMGLKQWVSPNDVCQVTNDLDLGVDDFVDCSCRHLTHYAVRAKTLDRGLIGYPVWFFVSCFICMTGLLLAILAHHICSVSAMFSASLLMHMCFAAMATQICYVVAAYLSPDEIIVYTIGEDNYRCIVMALFLHYFFLCQFSWMMTQAVNFWKILVQNDEHTDRKYVLFFLLGWGIPVVIIAVFYVVTFNLYRYVYDLPYDFVYGDVNNNGQICFITNPYAGLGGLILPVLLMLVVVAVVFVKAFQVTPQWQAYDDIYRGRYNISEVRTLLLFWAVIIITWLWGGLHMVYGHLWMLIMFCIFNILQGLMAFVLYSLLRNPCLAHCLGPQRASSYSMTGHLFDPNQPQTVASPGAGQYQFHQATLDVGSLKGSRASLLNESWERDSIPGSRTTRSTMKVKRTLPQGGNLYIEPPVYQQNTISDTKDFDDLLYALKTGGSFTPSDGNSGESDRASEMSSNIDKYELRRIDIADTHL